MKGLSQSALAFVTGGCLVLVLASLIVATSTEEGVRRQTYRDRLFSTNRQRRDIDMEGLPQEIRERIAASRLRSRSRDRSNGTPNCWVEVDVPRRVGGQCRRIENMPACFVNDNLYINHPDCM